MKQITEDYCSFEIAQLLKEKGFDGDCDYWYDEYGGRCCSPSVISVECWCPAQSLALKWLREVHDIHITLHPSGGVWNGSYTWSVYYKRGKQSKDYQLTRQGHEKSYEEACEAALNYVLKNLI